MIDQRFPMKPEWLVHCVFAAMLVALVANNIRHLLLPDKITIPGILAGLLASWLIPSIHELSDGWLSLGVSAMGVIAGAGSMYLMRMGGKKFFGRQRLVLPDTTKVVFTTTGVQLPDEEIPYEDIFYRPTDQIETQAALVELIEIAGDVAVAGEGLREVSIKLGPGTLRIGDQSFDPSKVLRVEFIADQIFFPREVIGFGLVKLAGLTGAFLGWKGALFSSGCGTLALIAGAAGAMAMGMKPAAAQLEAATPLCIAALVWIMMGSHLWLAASIAVVLGFIASWILNRVGIGKGGS